MEFVNKIVDEHIIDVSGYEDVVNDFLKEIDELEKCIVGVLAQRNILEQRLATGGNNALQLEKEISAIDGELSRIESAMKTELLRFEQSWASQNSDNQKEQELKEMMDNRLIGFQMATGIRVVNIEEK